MLNIEIIRKNPELVKESVRLRGDSVPVDEILELDNKRRSIIVKSDDLRAQRNEFNKGVGRTGDLSDSLIHQMRMMGKNIKTLEEETRKIENKIETLMLNVPNIPRDDVPYGEDESDNVVVRDVPVKSVNDFTPLPHWEIGENLDIIDLQRGAKLSGSRFFILKGKGSRLQRALVNWMIDLHTNEHGYQEIYLPYLVNSTSVTSSGHLPKFYDTMYHDQDDDLWLVPTAEVPVTNLYRDEILAPGSLPLYYVAHTPCFRKEKSAAGRDTRGIKRVHQFEKVEMYKLVEPAESDSELERLVSDAESVCRRLEIPYRVIELSTGDLGFSAVKTFDIEMWAPGSEEWLEVSSCSNCDEFQARRASIRYRPNIGAKPQFVHTLNGSGLALPRVIIAILENYQRPDGTVEVPSVLRPYTGFDNIS